MGAGGAVCPGNGFTSPSRLSAGQSAVRRVGEGAVRVTGEVATTGAAGVGEGETRPGPSAVMTFDSAPLLPRVHEMSNIPTRMTAKATRTLATVCLRAYGSPDMPPRTAGPLWS